MSSRRERISPILLWTLFLRLDGILPMVLFLAVLVLANSAAFWLGNANMLAAQVTNAVLTFSLYPITLFDGTAKFLLFTVLPAAFIGAIPAEFVRSFSWGVLGELLADGHRIGEGQVDAQCGVGNAAGAADVQLIVVRAGGRPGEFDSENVRRVKHHIAAGEHAGAAAGGYSSVVRDIPHGAAATESGQVAHIDGTLRL